MKKRKGRDHRFDEIVSNPKFRKMRKDERKVVVDERFSSMFNDAKFTVEYQVDKRGRPIAKASVDRMNEYYEIDKPETRKTDDDANEEICEDDSDHEVRIDLARGEGNVSSSDDDDEDVSLSYDIEEVEQPWAELDANAPVIEDATNRMAVCNLDWEKVNSKDIFILFNSFKPAAGCINKVTVYVSAFGEERLKAEEVCGPQLDNGDSDSDGESDDSLDDDAKEEKLNEACRKSELQRLQYYYAVVKCDSAQTAECVYKECDGTEYELSGTKLDLRFIPDTTSFDDRPVKDECQGVDDALNYEPQVFRNSALTSTKVKVSWEEPDEQRQKKALQAFNADNFDGNEFDDLIASGSDDDNIDASVYKRLVNGNKLSDEESDLTSDADGDAQRKHDTMNEEKPMSAIEKRKERRKERKALMKTKKREKLEKKGDGKATEDMGGLALLTEEATGKGQNYNLRKIMQGQEKDDDFSVDVKDERFAAVFSSHHFNLDPSDPAYKDTPATRTIVKEKLKRRIKKGNTIDEKPAESSVPVPPSQKNDLSAVNFDSLRLKSKKIMDKRKYK